MLQDNALNIALSMGQRAPTGDLSKANLTIDYPNINRDAANIAQFELILGQIKSLIILTLTSPRIKNDSEQFEAYIGWLRMQGQELSSLADRMKVLNK